MNGNRQSRRLGICWARLVSGGGQYALGGSAARSSNPSVRAAGLLLLYLLGVLLGAALLAPPLHQLGQWAAVDAGLLPGLAKQPFHRYLNRCLLIAALVGLWPFIRAFRLNRTVALGWAWTPLAGRRLGLGLAVGFVSLSAVALGVVAVGVRSLNLPPSLPLLLALVGKAALTAIVVAVLEEVLFRGVIFGAMRQSWSLPVAIVSSGVIYAVLHFMARVEHPGPVVWHSGLSLLPRMMQGMIAPENLFPAGLTLTVGGAVLALAYARTGSLWFSIGLHAGWVFWLKVFKSLTGPGTHPGGAFWGTDKLLDGWLALLVMLGLLAGVACIRWQAQTPSTPDEPLNRPPLA